MDKKLNDWLQKTNPWTNVYGLSRTFLALATLLTLLVNDSGTFFRITSDTNTYPNCVNAYGLFCLADFNDTQLAILQWIAVIILVVVASGWRPRITGILHTYIAFSFNQAATTLDGGDQVIAVFTLILLPLTLTDKRKWHWETPTDDYSPVSKIIGISSYYAFRFQVAILYFHSVTAKLMEQEWRDGTAVWYYLQSPMLGFHEWLFELFRPLLSTSFIVVPTWGTLLVQILLVMSLFMSKKYWKYVLIAAIVMHEIFAIFLGLISFSLAMIGVLIMYLRPIEETFQFKGVKKFISGLKVIKNNDVENTRRVS